MKSWAQLNIVPNSSFEELVGCPHGAGQIDGAMPWSGLAGSPDYYHECGTNGYAIPINRLGNEYANSGQAYIGISLRSIGTPTFREFVGSTITNSLIPGKRYNVEFYTSQADSSWYAIKNIGAYFSIGEPENSADVLLTKIPQVKYEGGDYLDNKLGWTKIEGSFIADGGENFITIGNFDDNNETDTLFVGGGIFRPQQPDYWKNAYYYIDDVSVTIDTTTGISERKNIKFELYPTPTKDIVTVEIELREKTELQLTDIAGRVVLSIELTNAKATIDMSAFSQGVYIAALFQNNVAVTRTKIIKQ